MLTVCVRTAEVQPYIYIYLYIYRIEFAKYPMAYDMENLDVLIAVSMLFLP